MTGTTHTRTPGLDGLSSLEVRQRIERGEVNDVPRSTSRTVGEIVQANVFTRFNMLLGVLVVVVLFVAPIQDALFGFVLVANASIGIVQELRAKSALDRLALLSAPRARVVRGGSVGALAVDRVVLDDVLDLQPGDQIVVDGVVLASTGLEIDESLLTGESDPIAKHQGDGVLSGSFVAAGSGRYRATKVGRQAYAIRLAEEARKFTLVQSELRAGVDWILGLVGWLLVPTEILLITSQLQAHESLKEAIRSAVAGTVGMVPQGLVLLTSMAFAVGVIRLGRQNVLVQELPAVEGLARVDVICFDKTGTLTEGRLTVHEVQYLTQTQDLVPALGALAATDPTPNGTVRAIAAAFAHPVGWRARSQTPFSSDRKWSGTSFVDQGTWVLGAPEVVFPDEPSIIERAERLATDGYRVLVVGKTPEPLRPDQLPDGLQPVGLVLFGDRVRDDVTKTLEFFERQGVQTKVISGDHPHTVAAIARRVGIRNADRVVDGRDLREDDPSFEEAVEKGVVFGRVTPHQKRRMIAALQARGHTVAMTGDGVNDVLALKDADIGIAMGSGSSASRAVAEVVLVDGNFDHLPAVVGEGRRVIANIERVANLFVTKTVYAMLLVIGVALAGQAFPFLPRHLTLVGSITIGIPAFFLALEPTTRRARRGFLFRVMSFAVPAGTLAAFATFAAYNLTLAEEVPLLEARTVATLVLSGMGFFALLIVSRPLTAMRRVLIGGMILSLVLIVVIPTGREFYAIELPRLVILLAAGGIVGASGGVIYFSLRTMGWLQQVPQVRAIVEESEVVLTKVEQKVVEVAGPVVKRAGASVRRVRRNSTAAVKNATLRAGKRVHHWVKEGSGQPRKTTRRDRNLPGSDGN
ncbi:MAG: HAD-IC family P-type ATPase [Acidimicrobiia bacterium]